MSVAMVARQILHFKGGVAVQRWAESVILNLFRDLTFLKRQN